MSHPEGLSSAPVATLTAPTPTQMAELAERYGLRRSAARPPLPAYIGQVWQRRHFIRTFATSRNIAMYTDARLGQVWQVLTPLLNAAVYYLIFGILLGTSRGISDFIGYLVTGIFVFNFTQNSFLTGSRAIGDNLALIRALQFPRACMPFSYVIVQLQQMGIALVVLAAIILAKGEPLSWYWFLIIPVLLTQTVFNIGAGLVMARVGAQVRDFQQLLPFILRTWMYLSGVMFSIAHLTSKIPSWFKVVLSCNPAAIYIDLSRFALMKSFRVDLAGTKPYNAEKCHLIMTGSNIPGTHIKAPPHYNAFCHAIIPNQLVWGLAFVWALILIVGGFVFFWRAEEKYGRG